MQRIAAIDYGLKRIGLAVSDSRASIALPLKMVSAGKNLEASAKNVLEALDPYRNEIETILIGLPLLMNGTRGEMANIVEKFAEVLRILSKIRVECVDERLTSAQAERALKGMEMSRKERSRAIDSVSATILLQAYLDRRV